VCPRIAVLIAVAVIAGCNSPSDDSMPKSRAASTIEADAVVESTVPPISEVPVTMTVEQRSTTAIPGSGGKLSLTIDDITRGQVVASVLDADNTAIAGPISLTTGQIVDFKLDDTDYHLRLEKLANAPIGSDFATFVIDVAAVGDAAEADVVLTESQKIDRLIAAIESLPNAMFVRNGDEHTAAEAAEHLRNKLSAAGDRIQTAEDFIDQIASGSSLSGKAYLIRMGDSHTITAEEFLQQELQKLEPPR
jgi:hypothetical protein